MATLQRTDGSASPGSRSWAETLSRGHRKALLAFVARRVDGRATAEELLQVAMVRALEHGIPADDEAAALRWFHRVLRNLVIDHHRARGAAGRALGREALESTGRTFEHEEAASACACLHDVLPALKPEYASMVRAVHLDERPVHEVAASQGLTANNASVRLHRARAALKSGLEATCGRCAAAGCLDCTCKRPDREASHHVRAA